MLATELAVVIFTQFNRQLIRGAEQQHAPDIAQQIDDYRNHGHRAHPHQYLTGSEMLRSDAIHNDPDHFGRDQLEDSDNDKQGHGAEIATPLPTEVPA